MPRDEFIFSGRRDKMAASPRTTLSYSYYYYYIWRRRRRRWDVQCVYIYILAFLPPTTLSPNPSPWSSLRREGVVVVVRGWRKAAGAHALEPRAHFAKTLANLYKPPPPRRRCRRRYTLGKMRATERLQRVIRMYTYCTIRTGWSSWRETHFSSSSLQMDFAFSHMCWAFSPTRQPFSFSLISNIQPPLVTLVFYNAVSLFSYYTLVEIKSSKPQRSVHRIYCAQV